MPTCDLCAKPAAYKVSVEGAEMNVCDGCKKFGKVVSRISAPPKPKPVHTRPVRQEEPEEFVVSDVAQQLKKKREQLSMDQSQFANMLNEKQSLIHSFERGHVKPSLDQARKLGKKLGLLLVEKGEEKFEFTQSKKSEGFTMGDFIKIRKSVKK